MRRFCRVTSCSRCLPALSVCTLCPRLPMRPPLTPHKRSTPKRPKKWRTPKRKAAPKRKRARTPKKKKRAPKKRTPPKKRAPKKRAQPKKPKRTPSGVPKRLTKAQRSEAAKAVWRKRKAREKLINMLGGDFRKVHLFGTTDELHDWLKWGGQKFDVDIGDMYRMYWGSEVGEPSLDVWET